MIALILCSKTNGNQNENVVEIVLSRVSSSLKKTIERVNGNKVNG